MTRKQKKASILRGFLYLLTVFLFIVPVSLYTFYNLNNSKSSYTDALKQQKETNNELVENQEIFNGLNSNDALIRYARAHYIFVKDNEKVINLPLEN